MSAAPEHFIIRGAHTTISADFDGDSWSVHAYRKHLTYSATKVSFEPLATIEEIRDLFANQKCSKVVTDSYLEIEWTVATLDRPISVRLAREELNRHGELHAEVLWLREETLRLNLQVAYLLRRADFDLQLQRMLLTESLNPRSWWSRFITGEKDWRRVAELETALSELQFKHDQLAREMKALREAMED